MRNLLGELGAIGEVCLLWSHGRLWRRCYSGAYLVETHLPARLIAPAWTTSRKRLDLSRGGELSG